MLDYLELPELGATALLQNGPGALAGPTTWLALMDRAEPTYAVFEVEDPECPAFLRKRLGVSWPIGRWVTSDPKRRRMLRKFVDKVPAFQRRETRLQGGHPPVGIAGGPGAVGPAESTHGPVQPGGAERGENEL